MAMDSKSDSSTKASGERWERRIRNQPSEHVDESGG